MKLKLHADLGGRRCALPSTLWLSVFYTKNETVLILLV
jgi:hypothetical protein